MQRPYTETKPRTHFDTLHSFYIVIVSIRGRRLVRYVFPQFRTIIRFHRLDGHHRLWTRTFHGYVCLLYRASIEYLIHLHYVHELLNGTLWFRVTEMVFLRSDSYRSSLAVDVCQAKETILLSGADFFYR